MQWSAHNFRSRLRAAIEQAIVARGAQSVR
jgi:hypothetical protein